MQKVKTRYFIWVVTIITIIFQLSCEKKDCLSSAGNRTLVNRDLAAFKQIELSGFYNVYLKSDTFNRIEIEAGGNLIKNIETSVVDSILTIKDLNACGFIKGYAEKKLYITFNSLSEINIYDGVNLYSSDTLRFDKMQIKFLSDIGYCDIVVNCNKLNFQVWNSSGDFHISGISGYFYLWNDKLAFVYANLLEAASVYVYNKSMGDSYVKTNGRLTVLLKDEGNIYYSGTPSEIVVEEKTGTGNLIKIE